MKFQSKLAVQAFLAEVKAFDKLYSGNFNEAYVPTDEEMASFIKARNEYTGTIKNHRKSANQKANWRENRTKMMKGIKAFHKSVEGKRFHRKMGRFLASRLTNNNKVSEAFNEKLDFILGLNSLKQHLFVELSYYHRVTEQIELEEMMIDYAIPMLRVIEDKIIKDIPLTVDEVSFVSDLTSSQQIVESISELTNLDEGKVKEIYQEFTDKLEKEDIAKDSVKLYSDIAESFLPKQEN